MENEPPVNLDQLLERLGSDEAPGDSKHRYALRRALLNSPVFEPSERSERRSLLFGATASLMAGGMMVAVLAVGGGVLEDAVMDRAQAVQGFFSENGSPSEPAVFASSTASEKILAEETEPVSDTEVSVLPEVELAEFSKPDPVAHVMYFVNNPLGLVVSQ